jgi:hypothetical protein
MYPVLKPVDTDKDILDRITIELKTSPEYLEISGLPPN